VVHKVGKALELLRRDGWLKVRQNGSHRQFEHPTKPGRVTVAGKDSAELAPKTWGSILRQAGLT
jgi:predicted RNA binding protein YcfA (HicA-like mRNA interferase family)